MKMNKEDTVEKISVTDQMNTELEEVFMEVLKKFADRTGNDFKYLNYKGFTANFDESGLTLEWNVSAKFGWKPKERWEII